jgi:WD40 repeat protein
VNGIPDGPYKGLAAFEDSEVDALLFFGRARESAAVAANVLASRLTVLYGTSGVGKSSLLRAGVARRLRELTGAPVVVHDAWAEDAAEALVLSIRNECGDLGATAGLVDTVAAAAQASGELHLLLDQFEEYVLYHGVEGPLSSALPELLRRPGLRVNVLIGLRDDALAELDEFSGRIPDLFGNLLRLDRLDRDAGREAIVGPLARYGELIGEGLSAEPALVEEVLDEVSEGRIELGGPREGMRTDGGVEAPYLQLVLERLWARERELGSTELRLATLKDIGGARAVARDHVRGALERLTAPEQEAAARVVRQLITPSGRKISHEAADLSEYAHVEDAELRPLLETLSRERIVRGVNGRPGAPTRYELFHDVLAPPLLVWHTEHEVERERTAAARQRRRLLTIVAVTAAALVVVAGIAAYALVERSNARSQARQAHGREIAADALAEIPTNPAVSLRLALQAAALAPGRSTENVLRSSLIALREERVLRIGGDVVAADFAPRGERLLVAGSNGRIALYAPGGGLLERLPRQPALTLGVWSANGHEFATGAEDGSATVWRIGDTKPLRTIRTTASVTALALAGRTLLVGSGTHLRLVDLGTGRTRTLHLGGAVLAGALQPDGRRFAVSFRHGKGSTTWLGPVAAGSRSVVLREDGIRTLEFSPDGRLLATGSNDRTARIWNARSGRLLHVLPQIGYVLAVRFSPDGSQLVTSNFDGGAYVWDVATGQRELLLVGATGSIEAAAFSPDASEIATASTDRLARIYDGQDGRLLAPLAGHADSVTSVDFDPSGSTLATGSADRTVRLWSGLPEGTLTTIDTEASPVTTLFAGSDVVSVAGREARLLTPSGRLLGSLKFPAPITGAAAMGSRVAVVDRLGDVATGWNRTRLATPGFRVTAVAFTRHGKLLLGAADGTVRGFDANGVAQAGAPVLAISTGDDRFLVRTAREIRVYDDDGSLVSTIRTPAQRAVLSPDGSTVATTRGLVAQLWDAATGKLQHTLAGHRSAVTDAEFSPNSQKLVTASVDHTARIWDVSSGRTLHVLVGHILPVRAVTYSPDGRWIVTASQLTAGLWNAANGQFLFYLVRNTKPLTGASFSPSGKWILTGSNDGTARVFHCTICESLAGLENVAEARLHALR